MDHDEHRWTHEAEAPAFSDARAESMVGESVLVGVTHLTHDGEMIRQDQFHGTIESVDAVNGIAVRTSDGSLKWLPPDLDSFERAAPGEYRLRSTGEVVEDPAYVSTWVLNEPRA